MKRLVISSMIMFCFFSTIGFSETKTSDPKQAERMKAWMDYATPGAGHKVLSGLVGKWKYTSKYWESEDAKPQQSKGHSTMKMIMGGRFLQHDTKGKAMGMAFTGLGITGYNNLTKKYETFWLDNTGTGMVIGSASYDEETHTLKDKGEFACPMHGGKVMEYRSEWKIVDKDHTIFTMWGPSMDSDKQIKTIEMVFKRIK